MKINIGVIGPKDTVDLISEIMKEYEDKVTMHAITFSNITDLAEILPRKEKELDLVLFSGPVPYYWTKRHLNLGIDSTYIPTNGSSLYKALYGVKERESLQNYAISCDTLAEKEVKEVLNDLNIKCTCLFTYDVGEEIDYEKLIAFHENLYNGKKVNVVLTCLSVTYLALKKKGINVYRVLPTNSRIRETIAFCIESAQKSIFKFNQIAIVIFKIESFRSMIQEKAVKQINKLRLKVFANLIDFGECCDGLVISYGNDEFIVITTQGSLEAVSDSFAHFNIIKHISKSLNITINAGVGFGSTANIAEMNARLGLEHCASTGGSCAFIVSNGGNVLGPLESGIVSQYNIKLDDEFSNKMADSLQISRSQAAKLVAILSKAKNNKITSSDFANMLGVTIRSARRILNDMESKGYIEVAGKEKMHTKGRSRVVYKMLF